jgi:hypothetical protein
MLASVTSKQLSELMALRIVENEEQKQAQLNAKAQAAEEKLRNKRKWQR